MKTRCIFTSLLILSIATFPLASCTVSFTNLDLTQFSKLPNPPHDIQQKLLLKAVLPSYIQEVVNLIHGNSTSTELLQSGWFDGVEWPCKLQMVDWLTRLKPEYWGDIIKEDQKWVLQMIDAWGKIPEGIMSGHTSSFGDFDQCVQTEANILELVIPDGTGSYKFDGMYCQSYFVYLGDAVFQNANELKASVSRAFLNSSDSTIQDALSIEDLLKSMLGQTSSLLPLIPSVGTCFPNVCSINDVQMIMINGMKQIYSKHPGNNLGFYFIPVSCTDRHKPELDAAAISVITILSILVALALVAGVIDFWQRHYKMKSTITRNKAYKYLMAFSLYTNTKKLFNTRRCADDLGCLHGIRFLSTAWVVLGHAYATFAYGPQWNVVDFGNAYKNWTQMAIFNGTFSVDTFFLMSGMLATYNILKMLDKNKGKLNILMLYVHRYIRLTPTYAILIGIAATLVTYAGNGPMWWYMEPAEEYCRKNWWTNLLYINNLVNTNEMCNGESWYLANDMQFFILAPLIIYPIWKWELIGTILLCIYTVLSCVAPVLVTRYATGAPPAALMTRPDLMGTGTGFVEIYQRPWSRISTFLVGVWLGWILHKTRGQRVKMNKLMVTALWLVSTATVLALILGIKPWFDPDNEIPKVGGYFYAGLSRFSFAMAVAWVMFACLKGYGGIVNEFLCWKAFMPLGRLCFCVYLVSFHLQQIFHARLTVPIKWDTYTEVNLYFSQMVISYFVGYICTVLFESPFIVLQKLLFEAPRVIKKEKLDEVESGSSEIGNEHNNKNGRLASVKVT